MMMPSSSSFFNSVGGRRKPQLVDVDTELGNDEKGGANPMRTLGSPQAGSSATSIVFNPMNNGGAVRKKLYNHSRRPIPPVVPMVGVTTPTKALRSDRRRKEEKNVYTVPSL